MRVWRQRLIVVAFHLRDHFRQRLIIIVHLRDHLDLLVEAVAGLNCGGQLDDLRHGGRVHRDGVLRDSNWRLRLRRGRLS